MCWPLRMRRNAERVCVTVRRGTMEVKRARKFSGQAGASAARPYARLRMSRTCVAAHVPPRAVRTPRELSTSAMARSDFAPAFCASRMIGSTFAANRFASAFTRAVVEAAEQRGHRTKKTLEIDPIQTETVRLIFRLAREGDGSSGPMGVKSMSKHLNAAGIRTRDGGHWGVGSVHNVLTRTTYIGRHRFNTRFWKTRERKPDAEVVEMAVPPIIDAAEFEGRCRRCSSCAARR
jgi:Recombinase